jgi:hypothetical protein
MFAVTKEYTPLFNTERIDEIFKSKLPFDHRFLLPQLETVLFPNAVLEVIRECPQSFQVKTREYPASFPLFADKRSVRLTKDRIEERHRKCPKKEQFLERLLSFPKCPYIWGGTNPHGIPQWIDYYPPKRALSSFEFAYWIFRGVDCSGLLYHVTDGFTPRNTKELYTFGSEVNEPKPFDLVLYPGHVLIVLPNEKVIECRHLNGIVVSSLKERLKESEHLGLTFRRFL